ncbi:9845_t:CDS:2 [Racocetra persica]|uniref:9845_t:CDS:1 n=1 Tax=Racocetra persica TaxID=160502 RepID=A0ACA9L4G1_9GLOM|nr:9845_t:CDS:2 [Racocetra persica]
MGSFRRQQSDDIRVVVGIDDNASDNLYLPPNLDYKKAISDYLNQMKRVIEVTLDKRWPGLKLSQVLFVLCVPAKWRSYSKAIMRDCAYKAGLLNESIASRLLFITESEAAAIYCLSVIKEHKLTVGGWYLNLTWSLFPDTFLVVDCGGGIVDLTMRTLLPGNKLKKETVETGNICGSTYVDQGFLHFMGSTVGFTALQRLRSYAYGDLQKLVHRFFIEIVKLPFTGDPDEFETIELDLERDCPSLIKYITGAERINLEYNEWIIELEFETVKKMFDPVIGKIIELINNQLLDLTIKPVKRKCKAMFLVGGFSESPYLRKRVREMFQESVPIIAFPRQPVTAVVRGAVKYGLDMGQVESLVLNESTE